MQRRNIYIHIRIFPFSTRYEGNMDAIFCVAFIYSTESTTFYMRYFRFRKNLSGHASGKHCTMYCIISGRMSLCATNSSVPQESRLSIETALLYEPSFIGPLIAIYNATSLSALIYIPFTAHYGPYVRAKNHSNAFSTNDGSLLPLLTPCHSANATYGYCHSIASEWILVHRKARHVSLH